MRASRAFFIPVAFRSLCFLTGNIFVSRPAGGEDRVVVQFINFSVPMLKDLLSKNGALRQAHGSEPMRRVPLAGG